MVISHLVAVSNNNVIGKDNDLPWKLKRDLQHFKNYTTGKTIVMGRKTYESIGRPLPNRRNIIISSTIRSIDGAEVFSSLEAALEALKHEDEIIITGGSYLFNDTTDIVNKLVITFVDTSIEDGDVFYSDIDYKKWNLVEESFFQKDSENEHDFSIKVYEKSTSSE
ncbi:MAG: dihydrofolate reductase [SAR86 cluster bacterium SAR86B]|jgi:dihydrofolate reductase|uniref:Dihydrofolate reductase n=1 Tax=SAR86 cluster bacterium SAR86B TaxID=1123867 RepID=J4V5L1_9GAMM|nr:MAG: dihydrofolate reductase [SAR86 cluster bacterium SAR86B]|tara:strand:- start:987 stop:1484 length:498 start_codon:yes stop_codon:yes gene_type:complete